MNLEKLWNYNLFLDKIFENLKNDNIDVADLELDHICYRVDSDEKYGILKNEIEKIGTLLIENIIWARKISTFKLNKAIIYKNRKIYILELPAPKKWSNYENWFEHVEFVIKESFDDFMKKYSNIDFKTKALEKEINPDIKIKYSDFSVKFHHNSLENVILEEKGTV